MRKVLLAISIGAIGAAVGYMVRKMEEKGTFDELKDDLSDYYSKGKKKAKNWIDCSKNEAEYIEEKASKLYEKGKDAFNNGME